MRGEAAWDSEDFELYANSMQTTISNQGLDEL
jgi:hypothetical protein